MPTGVPSTIASRLITMLPKKALSMPPSSPGGGVICVNSARLIEPRPLLNVVHMIQTSQNRPKIVASTASTWATMFLARRARRGPQCLRTCCLRTGSSVALPLGELAQHQSRDAQHHEGHQEQHEAQCDER